MGGHAQNASLGHLVIDCTANFGRDLSSFAEQWQLTLELDTMSAERD